MLRDTLTLTQEEPGIELAMLPVNTFYLLSHRPPLETSQIVGSVSDVCCMFMFMFTDTTYPAC